MVEEKTTVAGTTTGRSRLRQITDRISSLIFLSHSVKVFSSKWNLIRNKLNEIHSILTSLLLEFHDSGDPNSILSGIIQSFEDATNSCNSLAQKCIEDSYSGKLLMQSDLDIILVKFDTNLKSLLEFVNTSPTLSMGDYAIVVSKPGATTNRDDVKFYVKDLLCRFKVGRIDVRKQALISFNEVIQEDERCIKIGMELDGFVNVIMKFLNSKDAGIQEEGLKVMATICKYDSYKNELVGIGVVASLIRVLESGSVLSKELSVRCLIKLTMNSDNVWSILANGGVNALLKICSSRCDDVDGELVGLACGVLRNLIGVDEIKRFVVEEGVIPLLIKLVKSGNEASQISAIACIQVLASGNGFVRSLIVNEGGIRVLVRVLDPKSLYLSKARVKSMRALMILCLDSVDYMNSLKGYGFMDHILYHLLNNGEVTMQESALRAASWLSESSDEFKKAMGDAGFIPEIVKFLDAKSIEAREIAGETLLRLFEVPRNQKRFVKNDQNVNLLLQLIDSQEGYFGNRKILLSIIMSLTFCNEGRKKITSSEYLKNIEKLADEQVLDAKKIVRNLSANRLRCMIRGIWHS
ncbi:protein CELLULOSE SYNTHASE INTERACTIVE 1 [Rutidosis leptorrhynchoides]|uniref:protein CELLULOSE SYNTHASE INTERACTIVE 1 n=1 Tax=Rutidosis leptorrhynchoides TaxID=125765 RepID=UPI003A9A255A